MLEAEIHPTPMRLTVLAKPNASTNQVIKLDDFTYKVLTTATPEKGKANEKVLELLAEFLGVPRRRLVLRFGRTAREKIVELTEG